MIKFLKKYNELWLLPLAFVLWLVSPYFIHLADETAATYDLAVIQKLIYGLMVFSFSTFNCWIVLRLTFPGIFRYLTEDFDKDFSTLTKQQKCVRLTISLAVFSLYLLGLLLSMQVL